jgi:hypothetical protein
MQIMNRRNREMITQNSFDLVMRRLGEVWKVNVQSDPSGKTYLFDLPNHPHLCEVLSPWPHEGEKWTQFRIRFEGVVGLVTQKADLFRCLYENYSVGPPFFAIKIIESRGTKIPLLVMVDVYQLPWDYSEDELWDVVRLRYLPSLTAYVQVEGVVAQSRY